jgi:long-chain acyl-CoA synthetase
MKIRRGELARLIASGRRDQAGPPERSVAAALASAAAGERLDDDLSLTSLERLELLAEVEDRLGGALDEHRLARARTVGDLQRLLQPEALRGGEQTLLRSPLWLQPRWTRWAPFRVLRAAAQDGVILPLLSRLIELEVRGAERLDLISTPVIFAANHASHFDTAVICRALPRRLRRRLAPAMSQDYFGALFGEGAGWRERLTEGSEYLAALALFNAFPLPQKIAGAGRALHYGGELVDAGYSILIYPEGTRSVDGSMRRFQPGIGLIARKLGLPVVPVRLEGMFEIYSQFDARPRRGRARVTFGEALEALAREDYATFAKRVEERVLKLAE